MTVILSLIRALFLLSFSFHLKIFVHVALLVSHLLINVS